jgi:3-oxoacyl-[acyl-carrier-protein] synthase II
VITGQAAISAAGGTVVQLLAAMDAGVTRLAPPTVVADSRTVAVPVGEFAVAPAVPGLPRLVAATLSAVRQALADAALDEIGDTDTDVVVGTGSGCRSPDDWRMGGVAPPVDLIDLADRRCGAIAEAVGAEFGLNGRVVTINTACSSGLNAVAHGWGLIRTGRARRVICIGADEFSAGLCFGFQSMGIMAAQPCQPFSRSVGTSLGDGVGVVVLETPEVAASRSARWRAEVVGVGQSADALHPSKPDASGGGPCAAIDQALDCAGARARDVVVVVSHGTGTAANDTMEHALHERRFGTAVPLLAAKGIIGHTHGASGLVELPLAVAALDSTPAPDDGPRLPALAIKNAWAMGGLNSSVVLRGRTVDGAIEPDGAQGRFPVVELVSRRDSEDLLEIERPDAVRRMEWARTDLLTKLTLVAVDHLLARVPGSIPRTRIGLAFATQRGPLLSWELATEALRTGKALNPALVPRLAHHAAASTAARVFDLRGAVVAYTSGATSGLHAFEHALTTLETGRADAMLVVVADEYTGPDQDTSALREHAGVDVCDPRFSQLHEKVGAPDARPGASAALLAVSRACEPATAVPEWCAPGRIEAAAVPHDLGQQAPQVLIGLLDALSGSPFDRRS